MKRRRSPKRLNNHFLDSFLRLTLRSTNFVNILKICTETLYHLNFILKHMLGLTLISNAENNHKNKLLRFFLIFVQELAPENLLQFLNCYLNFFSYTFHHTSEFEQVLSA